MIKTREARTNDEAWMIEKLNLQGQDVEGFKPQDFLVVIDEDTEDRLAFGRTEYVRNEDRRTDYVEINSLLIVGRGEDKHGELLISDLVDRINRESISQVFAFPHRHKNSFYNAGFEDIDPGDLPDIMNERLKLLEQKHGDEVVPIVAQTSKVDYEESEDDEGYDKPDSVSEEEVERIKEDLDIKEDSTTKYSV